MDNFVCLRRFAIGKLQFFVIVNKFSTECDPEKMRARFTKITGYNFATSTELIPLNGLQSRIFVSSCNIVVH